MKKLRRAFFAYPANPHDLRHTIETASAAASNKQSSLQIATWPALDILGSSISDAVRNGILASEFLVADITTANYNVYYEIGYAIGTGRPVLPVINAAFAGSEKRIQEDGFFDNIKYVKYQNSEELKAQLEFFVGTPLLDICSKEQIMINLCLFSIHTSKEISEM